MRYKKTMLGMVHNQDYPIGVYDSGLGGLSVVRELMDVLPNESILYVADTARVPYGPKTQEEVIEYNRETINFLLSKGVKLIICACNTSSAMALPHLKNISPVPIYGMIEAGTVLPHDTRRVGLIATEGTIKSQVYRQAIQQRYPSVQYHELACPDFVPLVEQGHWKSSIGLETVMRQLLPLREKELNKIILGCTHYAYLRRYIQTVMGSRVQILDPAFQLVSDVKLLLKTYRLENPGTARAHQFYTSGHPGAFRRLAEIFLRETLNHVAHVNLENWQAQPVQKPVLDLHTLIPRVAL